MMSQGIVAIAINSSEMIVATTIAAVLLNIANWIMMQGFNSMEYPGIVPGEVSTESWSQIGLEWIRHLFAIFAFLEALFSNNTTDTGLKKSAYLAVEFICGELLVANK